MSTRSAAVADPALARFIEQITDGSNAAADSVAGLILRLVGRVGRLEQTVSDQGSKLDKLAKHPQPAGRAKTHDSRSTRIVATGVDMDGHPVRIEERVRRPVGRPKGRRDTHQRQRRGARVVHPELEELRTAGVSLLDPDFDAS